MHIYSRRCIALRAAARPRLASHVCHATRAAGHETAVSRDDDDASVLSGTRNDAWWVGWRVSGPLSLQGMQARLSRAGVA